VADDNRGNGALPYVDWTRLKGAPYLPAGVLILILSVVAAVFAGSYSLAMANPQPHRIPTGVVGSSGHEKLIVGGLEKAVDSQLDLHRYGTRDAAAAAVRQQRVFAVIELRGDSAKLWVASAAGASVARVFEQTGPKVGAAIGVPITVADAMPLQPTDPQGLALFYVALASVIIGFVGAIQLHVHARELKVWERYAATAAYAILSGITIWAVVDAGLGVVDMPFPESPAIIALTMFAAGMVFSVFNVLIGRWAILPTWGLMVILGNTSSGGAVAWPLLPGFLAFLGRWLPPGASVSAQRNAIYFRHDQHAEPLIVLGVWAVVAAVAFAVFSGRESGTDGADGAPGS